MKKVKLLKIISHADGITDQPLCSTSWGQIGRARSQLIKFRGTECLFGRAEFCMDPPQGSVTENINLKEKDWEGASWIIAPECPPPMARNRLQYITFNRPYITIKLV